ncbi:Modification methylase HemK [Tolypocladium capitatum]|uniref:Modification methylase HemK n=1 Tax=Tolypocladium capitatum TaxID=45235 RepID=A0A2K3QP50_9HYPO|nr:Modification methylase HemK [Tolypocladium capitatum]
MPRLPPWLLRQANYHSPNLAALLPACRDLQSARHELRWIAQHVAKTAQAQDGEHLAQLCQQRGRGVPLQYILGSQPFGHLEVKCRPGVLIPRPETEAYTCHLVDLIKTGRLLGRDSGHGNHGLNIVDFCTGTGCIPLLLFSSLQQSISRLNVLGVDIAGEAVQLAQENIGQNKKLGHIRQLNVGQSLQISRGDVFNDGDIQALIGRPWDILISNPPYISKQVWDHGHGQLGYSVRKYEPRLALVPNNQHPVPAGWKHEDVFYSRLLDIAGVLQPKVVLLELGDEAQARRVLGCYSQHASAEDLAVELWRDWPDLNPDGEDGQFDVMTPSGRGWTVPVKGSGQIRCIFIRRRGE